MSEQDLEGRHKRVAEFVRALENTGKPETLYSVGVVSRRMAREMGLVETTARKYLKAAVAAGVVVEVKHLGRSLRFPWPIEEVTKGAPERFVQGSVNRGRFWMTEDRQVGPAMTKTTFLFTPDRLEHVMDVARQADVAKASEREKRTRERQQKMAAEAAAEEAVFAQHYPELARLLRLLRERVLVSGRTMQGVRMYAQEHPGAGILGTVDIEVRREGLAELEAVLRDGLGEAAEVRELP